MTPQPAQIWCLLADARHFFNEPFLVQGLDETLRSGGLWFIPMPSLMACYTYIIENGLTPACLSAAHLHEIHCFFTTNMPS